MSDLFVNEEMKKQQEQQIQKQQEQQQQKQKQEKNVYLEQAKAQQMQSIVNADWMQSEWMEREEIPEAVLNEQVAKHYEASHSGQKIGFFERSKAKKEYKKKYKTALKANKSMNNFFLMMSKETEPVGKEIKDFAEKTVKEGGDTGYSRDFKELLPLLKTKKDKQHYVKGATSDNMNERVEAVKPLLLKFGKMNEAYFEKFNYKSNEDILKNYTKYADVLHSSFIVSKMINSIKNFGGTFTEEEEFNIRASVLTLQTIKIQYETEIKAMQNPYYIMMRKEAFQDKGAAWIERKQDEYKQASFEGEADDSALEDYMEYAYNIESQKLAADKNRDFKSSDPYFDGTNVDMVYKLTIEDLKNGGNPKKLARRS